MLSSFLYCTIKNLQLSLSPDTYTFPSQENGRGYVTQIATQLFGDNRNILQTTDESKFIAMGLSKERGDYIVQEINGQTVYITNPDKSVQFTPNGASEGYLDDMKIYIDESMVAQYGIDHMFTNGIMNSVNEALTNQQDQQGNPTI